MTELVKVDIQDQVLVITRDRSAISSSTRGIG